VIPHDYITGWREEAPWVHDFQVEQDLVISRALVEIFSHPLLHESLAVRGGTALYKLHLKPAARYSEDIDLVQTEAKPAGSMMEAVRGTLDPWLGKPRWKQTEGRVTFVYRFDSEDTPPIPLRLKVETNTREHFSVYGLKQVPFGVTSRWFDGSCQIQSYELSELLATKLRALYQRKQGRDLFDLAIALWRRLSVIDRRSQMRSGRNSSRTWDRSMPILKKGNPDGSPTATFTAVHQMEEELDWIEMSGGGKEDGA
jgi:predicted nucleotidyltransferase component of viral defense system